MRITTGVISAMEKVNHWLVANHDVTNCQLGDGARNSPNSIFERKPKAKKENTPEKPKEEKKTAPKTRNPQTITQGLAMGTESMVTELAGAVFGLVAEPYKGK